MNSRLMIKFGAMCRPIGALLICLLVWEMACRFGLVRPFLLPAPSAILDAILQEPGLFLYFPRYASDAPKLRAFIDTLRNTLRVKQSN